MKLLKVEFNDFGGAPVMEHNMPCAIHQDEPAVYVAHRGILEPSWKARKEGWHLVRVDTWWKRTLMNLFFKGRG